MSAAAVIDSLTFAREGQELRGSVSVSELKRLEDVLFDTAGVVCYELRGGRDAHNRLQIQIAITGALHLQCQRCLGELEHELEVSNTLLLVDAGDEELVAFDDPDAPDAIEPEAELGVTQLIEDEVLLSLPLAPRHAEGTCSSRFRDEQSAVQPSAFAQLAALRRSRT